MLRLFKNKKAQNTAEYAILIALVVGAVVAMQTYAQRALQGRLRDAAVKFVGDTSSLGETIQYEPYYLNQRTRADKAQTDLDTYQQQTRSLVTYKRTASVDQTTFNNATIDSSVGGSITIPAGF